MVLSRYTARRVFESRMMENKGVMKYRKKPLVIEAIQWTGKNMDEVSNFIGDTKHTYTYNERRLAIYLYTLEGVMGAQKGDWLIKGVKGEFYPCKPDIFEITYELVGSLE